MEINTQNYEIFFTIDRIKIDFIGYLANSRLDCIITFPKTQILEDKPRQRQNRHLHPFALVFRAY